MCKHCSACSPCFMSWKVLETCLFLLSAQQRNPHKVCCGMAMSRAKSPDGAPGGAPAPPLETGTGVASL